MYWGRNFLLRKLACKFKQIFSFCELCCTYTEIHLRYTEQLFGLIARTWGCLQLLKYVRSGTTETTMGQSFSELIPTVSHLMGLKLVTTADAHQLVSKTD